MSATVLYMSMSIDGFIAGPNETEGNGLGDGGERLHDWAFRRSTLVSGEADLLDELEIHLIPVLFGQGRRLFEGLNPVQIEMERTRILEGEDGVTHMHYRIRR